MADTAPPTDPTPPTPPTPIQQAEANIAALGQAATDFDQATASVATAQINANDAQQTLAIAQQNQAQKAQALANAEQTVITDLTALNLPTATATSLAKAISKTAVIAGK
jgi:hypothetical protein